MASRTLTYPVQRHRMGAEVADVQVGRAFGHPPARMTMPGSDQSAATGKPATSAPICAAVPGTSGPRRHRDGRLRPRGRPRPQGRRGQPGPRYQAERWPWATGATWTTCGFRACCTAALRLTDHARADIVRIDTARALAAPGVVAVFTAAHVPGALRVGIIHKDWPVLIPQGGRTSYAGDVLAVVVAESRQAARAATGLVDVTYEPLPPLTDPMAAMASDQVAVWGTDGNVLSRSAYARGDVGAALAASAHVVHEVFQTQRVEHAFLEPESSLAVPRPDGGLHVYSGARGSGTTVTQIAAVLGTDQDQVSVELVSNGGAFGGKEDMSNQAQTALAAWLLRRPVKCTLSREESFPSAPQAPSSATRILGGCDQEGRLTGVRARMVGDSGAYASVGMKVLERAAGHATGPYRVPAVDVESIAVRTNNRSVARSAASGRTRPVRHGRVMDRLAELVGSPAGRSASATSSTPAISGARAGDGRRLRRRRALPGRPASCYDEARRAGKAVGLGWR